MPRGQATHHVEPQDELSSLPSPNVIFEEYAQLTSSNAPIRTRSNVIYGDQSSFPVYEPDPELLAARAAAYAASAPLTSHYDASRESRSKAAGFYQFSNDEATRQEQMDALKRDRLETEHQQELAKVTVVSEREREKQGRRAKIEEKRRQIDLKRKNAAAQ